MTTTGTAVGLPAASTGTPGAMEAIFKNLSKDTFRRFLRQAATADEIRTLLEEADNQLLAG